MPRTVTGGEPASAPLMRNHGRCFATGSSRSSLPASRCCITAMLVKSFEIEQIEYMVSAPAATLRLEVGVAEAAAPQQLLVVDDRHGDARQSLLDGLGIGPGIEQPQRLHHARIAGEGFRRYGCGCAGVSGRLRAQGGRQQ